MAGFLAVVRDSIAEFRCARATASCACCAASSTTAARPRPGAQEQSTTPTRKVPQLNLLNQADSTVIRGNLLTLPVGGGLLYVQPILRQGTG